jgi:hypothetical protein
MTNSPPCNGMGMCDGDVKVLASGFDTLYLGIELTWTDCGFLEALAGWKAEAKENRAPYPIEFTDSGKDSAFCFDVQPGGARGYEWLLTGHDVSMRIGQFQENCTRPAVMVEIGSEVLWRMGASVMVERVRELLESVGACVHRIMPSRVDVCIDVLMPKDMWGQHLLDYAVTRARSDSGHRQDRKFSGLSIGGATMKARLYDKVLEIVMHSGKTWMQEIWELEDVPQDKSVVRIEYQLRREVLRQLGLDKIEDLFDLLGNLWAYCTERWLKFQDKPGADHKLRQTLAWWRTVQQDFAGAQPGRPLIRASACSLDREQLMAQTVGTVTSMVTVETLRKRLVADDPETLKVVLKKLLDEVHRRAMLEADLVDTVTTKQARYFRLQEKHQSAVEERKQFATKEEPGRGGERSERPGDDLEEVGPDGTDSASLRDRGEREEGPSRSRLGIGEAEASDADRPDAGGLE